MRKTIWIGILSVLAACGSAPETSLTDRDFIESFKAILPQERTLNAVGSPLPAQVLVSGQISVTVEGHYGAAQTRDGSWIVQVPDVGARITAYSTTDGAAGAALNVRGTNQTDVHTQNLSLPCAVVPCDALVVTSTATQGRTVYWSPPGRSVIDEAVAIVFVPYAVAPGLLRPPAIGNNYLARFLRTMPLPESLVDFSKLPSVVDVDTLGVDWTSWGKNKPEISYLTNLLRRFSGEMYDGWSTDTRTPDWQHPGYGSAYASVVSQAAVMLCSTASAEAKAPLAYAIVQRGLDQVGATVDGRTMYPLGGHCAGRKALIVICGHLLNCQAIADPTAFVGPKFQEDGYFFGSWWFGSGWTACWRFRLEPPFDGSMLAQHPRTWGSVNSPNHDSWAWMITGYMAPVLGAQVGTRTAMKLLGRDKEMGLAFCRMVDQWMMGPPASAVADLASVGIVFPWQTDWSMEKGGDFCAAAWRRYAR